MNKLLLIAALLVCLVSCKKDIIPAPGSDNAVSAVSFDASTDAARISIISHSASPRQTDPDITTQTLGNPLQTAYLPADGAFRKDRLFVFIPGTFGTPSGYLKITRSAAYSGYYAFGVAYSNLSPIELYQGFSPDDQTVENILDEYLTGNNSSPRVSVKKSDGFENRIIKMIQYMDALYPSENWKRFLTSNGELIWQKISVAGHSQGSDHAMYMGQKRNMLRVGLFAGPGDFKLNNGASPSFMQNGGTTPRERVYGFNHTNDNVRLWSAVRQTWNVLQVPGLPESVDKRYLDLPTNQLTTSLPTGDGHGYVVSDSSTPDNAGGNPVYEPVWRYMSFP